MNRFQNEYLATLREMHSYQTRKQNSSADVIDVGDVVLVFDKDLPRTQWRLGLVTSLIKGSDDRVRAALVRTSNGRITSRAISRLYPLEVSCNDKKDSGDNDIDNKSVAENLRRSTRSCVETTNAKIKACLT